MPRLLLLIPTSTYRTEAFMDAALRLGVELVVASNRDNSLQHMLPGRFLTLDIEDAEAAAAKACAFAEDYPIDAVLGVDDPTVVPAAAIAEALELRSNTVAAARATRDKLVMRRLLEAAGLPGPAFRPLTLEDDPRHVAESLDYPVVLKPTLLGASRGVIRADDPTAFVAAFDRVSAILRGPELEGLGQAGHCLLAESFMPGQEVALEGLLRGGRLQVLALFDKPDPLDGPFFEETIYVTPSRHAPDTQTAIHEHVAAAAHALGLLDGPVHAELRVGPEGPRLLELAARTIGGQCARALRFGAGMSLEELVLRHALDLELPSPGALEPAGVMMIPIPRAGRLQGVRGVEAAQAVPGIDSVSITAHPGQQLVPLPEGSQYLGFIFAQGQTPAAVELALRDAHAALEISYDASDTTRSS